MVCVFIAHYTISKSNVNKSGHFGEGHFLNKSCVDLGGNYEREKCFQHTSKLMGRSKVAKILTYTSLRHLPNDGLLVNSIEAAHNVMHNRTTLKIV